LHLTFRQWLIVIHDVCATGAALLLTFAVRFEDAALTERLSALAWLFLPYLVYAAVIYYVFGLFKAKWRFISLPDLFNITRAVTVLTLSLLALDYVLVAPNVLGSFFFGKITIALYWFLQIAVLVASRIAYRYFRYSLVRQKAREDGASRTFIIGNTADAEVLLRAIESGAVKKIWPVGILSPSPADDSQSLRDVPVIGYPHEVEQLAASHAARGQPVTRLIMTPSALVPEVRPEVILAQARRLGMTVSRMPSLEGGGEVAQLAPVAVEDLLLRPSVQIDYAQLEDFVRGKSVVVTGGGGSIGSEICSRVVAFGAARLLVIEHAEPALHAVVEALATKSAKTIIDGRIGDIRDRERMIGLLKDFKPDVVFHAAALKHVPILERDWQEGIKTNVFGSVNVADAAIESSAKAMVMISTDKAIEPVSVLGATKRIAEMYCQALDAAPAGSDHDRRQAMRFISVRFGNVLASNGSVVPKFKAQIEAGGPITVTHPDMVRYFMTIREACDLVVMAARHAVETGRRDVSVYVLNMGQPVRIVDLARNMIRLSGLDPDRDIGIVFTGIRPGERLNEILLASAESSTEIDIAGITAATPVQPSLRDVRNWLQKLERELAANERDNAYRVLREAVPDFQSDGSQSR
jgi:O-antigen biosynthesis protein WbqV